MSSLLQGTQWIHGCPIEVILSFNHRHKIKLSKIDFFTLIGFNILVKIADLRIKLIWCFLSKVIFVVSANFFPVDHRVGVNETLVNLTRCHIGPTT